MYNYFLNKTKAEVLSNLSKKKLIFKIPKTFFFKVNEWHNNKALVLENIITEFITLLQLDLLQKRKIMKI